MVDHLSTAIWNGSALDRMMAEHFGHNLSMLNPYEHDILFTDIDQSFFNLSPLNLLLLVLYGVVFIVGLLGNVLVILVIIKFKNMRTLTNVFLVNLTVGDLHVILICVPVTLGASVYTKWIYGEVLCKLVTFIQGSAVGISVLSLLAISVSRYFAIYKPLTAKIVFKKRNVRFMLVSIWLISFVSFSPLLAVNNVTTWGYPGVYENKICIETWDSHKEKTVYNIFVFCMLFVVPFLLMTIAYAIIGHTLWISNTMLFSADSKAHAQRNNQILRQRRKTVKMLICVIIIFGICWLPYYCVNFWIEFHFADKKYASTMEIMNTYVYPLVVLLGLANSAVNPICYCFLSQGFRRAFKKMFCYGMVKRSSTMLRSSWRFKSNYSETMDTAQV